MKHLRSRFAYNLAEECGRYFLSQKMFLMLHHPREQPEGSLYYRRSAIMPLMHSTRTVSNVVFTTSRRTKLVQCWKLESLEAQICLYEIKLWHTVTIRIFFFRSSREREACDYAGSDAQSVSSRLSMLSVEAEQHPFSRSKNKNKQFRKTTTYRNEDPASASQSSDYEDQDEFSTTQQCVTLHAVSLIYFK